MVLNAIIALFLTLSAGKLSPPPPKTRASKLTDPSHLSILTLTLFSCTAVAENTGDLRTAGVGYTKSAGRLEIFMAVSSSSGSWGTVSFVNFTKEAADVACHQLGYSGAVMFDLAVKYARCMATGYLYDHTLLYST